MNRATVIEWLDANDIEVTDRQMDGLFHFAAPTTQPAPQQEAQEPVAWYEYNGDLDAWFLAYSHNPKAKTRPLVFGDAAPRAIEAEVRKEYEALIRQAVGAASGRCITARPAGAACPQSRGSD